MREKRVWPPARKEADAAETVAQFEATVAVAKQTVAKSDEVLVSAKQALNDHQRWLQVQTAAVEADRIRHERWLQRQRDSKEAAERREEARNRRQARFQRIGAGIKRAVMAVVHAITGTIGFVVGKIVAAIAFVLRSIGNALAFVGAGIRDGALYLFGQLRFALLWLAVKMQELFGAAGAKLVAGFAAVAAALGRFTRSAGRTISGAFSGLSARAGSLARSTGEVVSSGVSQVSAKTQALATRALERQPSVATAFEDRSAPAPENGPVSSFDVEAERPGGGEAIETSEAPAYFRTAAERAELPSVSEFVSARAELPDVPEFVSGHEELPAVSEFIARPEEFVRSEASSETAGGADEEAAAFAEPPAEPETVARSETAAESFAGSEVTFGSEGRADPGVAAGSWIADRVRAFGHDAGARAAATFAAIAATFAAIAAMAATLGRRATASSAAAFALGSAKFREVAPTAGERVSQFGEAAGQSLKGGLSGMSARARECGQAAASALKPVLSGVSGKVHTIAPAFHALVAEAGGKARHYAGAGAALAAGGMAKVKSVRDAGKNALSSPPGIDRDRGEISRMLIIAGILMLVCGALLIGSGLILRAGAPSLPTFSSPFTSPSEPSEAEEAVDVVWLYDDPERSLVERTIFTGSDGAGGIRLTGLAFSAENWSDHTLTDLHGTVKPDLKIIDFKLAIDIPRADGAAAVTPAPNTVPPRTSFMLVVPFPREVMDGEEGVQVEDFLGDYGGLTLKVRYAVDGKERSYIQYLSPAMLRAQLAEIAGGADSLARATE